MNENTKASAVQAVTYAPSQLGGPVVDSDTQAWSRTANGTAYHLFGTDDRAVCRRSIRPGAAYVSGVAVDMLLRRHASRVEGLTVCTSCRNKFQAMRTERPQEPVYDADTASGGSWTQAAPVETQELPERVETVLTLETVHQLPPMVSARFGDTMVFHADGLVTAMSARDAAEMARLRAEISALRAERHETNEALSDAVEALREQSYRMESLEK